MLLFISSYMKESITYTELGFVTKPFESVEGNVFFPIFIGYLDNILLQRQRPNKAKSKL